MISKYFLCTIYYNLNKSVDSEVLSRAKLGFVSLVKKIMEALLTLNVSTFILEIKYLFLFVIILKTTVNMDQSIKC